MTALPSHSTMSNMCEFQTPCCVALSTEFRETCENLFYPVFCSLRVPAGLPIGQPDIGSWLLPEPPVRTPTRAQHRIDLRLREYSCSSAPPSCGLHRLQS